MWVIGSMYKISSVGKRSMGTLVNFLFRKKENKPRIAPQIIFELCSTVNTLSEIAIKYSL